MTQPSARWHARLKALSGRFDLDDGTCARLATLLELIRDDETAPTTVRDPAAGVDVHVADSLVALELPAVRAARRIADLGSGAGLPGLVLAAALPGARVTLVESTRRKCAFLDRAVDAMGLGNATVARARAEDLDEREADLVTARALAPLAVLVEYAAPLLRMAGTLVAWKGRRDEGEEAAGVPAASVLGLDGPEVHAVHPFEGADHRHLYLYSKVRQTPSRFPRRAGMARKRPLSG